MHRVNSSKKRNTVDRNVSGVREASWKKNKKKTLRLN